SDTLSGLIRCHIPWLQRSKGELWVPAGEGEHRDRSVPALLRSRNSLVPAESCAHDSYIMFWYQQGPRGSLDWIYREGDAYGEGLQGGFKGTVLSSQNRCTLQLQAAKQGDEAVYYCGAWGTVDTKYLFVWLGSAVQLVGNVSNREGPDAA
uniref:Immunoglobulin V-set domain-containing protein n=1 Tax=Bubo bubo TaxID=30461 RepID=A0A8C0ICF9_BUBBB